MSYKLIKDEDKVPNNFWEPGYNDVRGLAKVRKTGQMITIAHGDTIAIRLMTLVVAGITVWGTYTFWNAGEYIWAVGCGLLAFVMVASIVHPFRWVPEKDRSQVDIWIMIFVVTVIALVTLPLWEKYIK